MTLTEREHWARVAIGLGLPILWSFGYTLWLVFGNSGSLSDSIRHLAVERGYTMLAVGVTGLFTGLVWHWFH